MKMFQSNIHYFMNIKVYIVFIQEIWVQIYGYFWVQSLCLLGACLWLGWVQSMRKLVAKCKVYEYFWVHVYVFWVHVYGSAGCMYAVVGCKVSGYVWVHA